MGYIELMTVFLTVHKKIKLINTIKFIDLVKQFNTGPRTNHWFRAVQRTPKTRKSQGFAGFLLSGEMQKDPFALLNKLSPATDSDFFGAEIKCVQLIKWRHTNKKQTVNSRR